MLLRGVAGLNAIAARATTQGVTTATGEIEGAGDSWAAIRADSDIQFAPVEVPPRDPPPEWLVWLSEMLGKLLEPVAQFFGASWPVMKWVLLVLAIALAALLIWRIVEPLMPDRNLSAEEGMPEWVPDQEEALALLEEADRLAQAGKYDEATHLLLKRSVNHIAAAQPDWLEPSSTAREIALIPALSETARGAFSAISSRVERSLFALQPLGRDDWDAARKAYSDFALVDLTRTEVAA